MNSKNEQYFINEINEKMNSKDYNEDLKIDHEGSETVLIGVYIPSSTEIGSILLESEINFSFENDRGIIVETKLFNDLLNEMYGVEKPPD